MQIRRTSTAHDVNSAGGQRRGATMVEFAIVGPLCLLIVIGLIVGGLGVFRYHQVAALAHESARWASVHGPDYSRMTSHPMADSDAVLNTVIRPRASGLDLSQLTCELTWGEDQSTVEVVVSYQWTPEALWTPVTFSSSATSFVTY